MLLDTIHFDHLISSDPSKTIYLGEVNMSTLTYTYTKEYLIYKDENQIWDALNDGHVFTDRFKQILGLEISRTSFNPDISVGFRIKFESKQKSLTKENFKAFVILLKNQIMVNSWGVSGDLVIGLPLTEDSYINVWCSKSSLDWKFKSNRYMERFKLIRVK